MRALKFHPDYIRSLMASKDVYDYQLGDDMASRILRASEALSAYDYKLSHPVVRKVPDRLLRLPRTWEDKLLIRHVNRKLKLALNIDPPNRHVIVSQIATLLHSDVPLRILRTDIRKFFDSVSIEETIQTVLKTGCLRQREEDVLIAIHKKWGPSETKGLPWGIPLSSTLAELALHQFDKMIQRTPGVLYYRRFVDDIIVIAPSKSSFSISDLEALLPDGLRFAPEKTYDIIEPHQNGSPSINAFDYLGYRFERSIKYKNNKHIPVVSIGISEKKLNRLEARIRLVGREFRRDRNFQDLTGRLRMLTGNYFIKKAGHPKPIPVGIYFNYPKLNDFSGLDRLDKILSTQIISLRLYSRNSGLPTSPIKGLLKYSFRIGHDRRIKHRFSASDMRNFRSAWAYE